MNNKPYVIQQIEQMLRSTPCGHRNKAGVQYHYTLEEHYDGVSEWHCQECGKRFGRWTGKEIPDGYSEPKYGRGGEPVKHESQDKEQTKNANDKN